MIKLWTGEDVVAAIGGHGPDDWSATGVSVDTRTLRKGDLFVALKHIADGHDYVAEAFEKGAVAAIVCQAPTGVSDDMRLVTVPDTLRALRDLARAARFRAKAQIVAVTGSVGKASTIGMLRIMLSGQGTCHASQASYVNQWDVPLSLATLPPDADFAVIKIGARRPGDIGPLSQLVQPHVAIVTRVAPEHLEAFGSITAIAHEKASIFDGLGKDGVAIFHGDDETAVHLRAGTGEGLPTSFGKAGNDWALRNVRLSRDVTVILANGQGQDYLFKLSVPGRHFAVNALGALAAVTAMGVDTVTATLDLAHWAPSTGRGTRERIVLDPANDGETIELLDDAFNANPTSVDTSLEVIAASEPHDNVGRIIKGRRVVILGDMGGLGAGAAQLHGALAQNCHLQKMDQVHCAGPLMYHLWRALPQHQRGQWAESPADLVPQVSRMLDAGDVVLVKGSAGSKISLVVDAIRKLGHRRPQEE
ncbi:UDP-N-acetylmuramoyl-tripeptide--D-alanyl-D-alanine ligase [Yoonia maritima]|uniref:UDP-N-acetylmuramoyl-tripeptide--D-alanyl-D-alanine ligase n=1 Tax=Yoonia maritima TaxID=1435347 RepID=A0A2T0W201_9RHOB|nr:UDP-N-acetylmuramoyl-tripeptide--D-alanyl-D-alanine ligase [Yoonia maritima]PRY79032.1 UDP-N-acetylmuramoyl-tripeptide--D-alanyl-D-alanine ligase [Yoonia maritima]